MRALLDLVLPVTCAGCGVPGPAACPVCLAAVAGPARPAWPTPSPAGLPVPYAVSAYADRTRALLLAYKEDGVVALARPLGAAIAAAASAAGQAVPAGRRLALVPVPSTRAARRTRGDDVVARLAREAARRLREGPARVHVDVVPALAHARAVADSAGLTAVQRAANLAGAFRLRRGAQRLVGDAAVVLADDLITTGATLATCAATLRAGGLDVVGAATVAATRRARKG